MRDSKGTRYSVMLTPPMEEALEELTQKLHTTKADVLRRSMLLFKHAVEADRVELFTKEGDKEVARQVLLK